MFKLIIPRAKSSSPETMATPAAETAEVAGLRPDLSSILPLLPLLAGSSSSLFWPPRAVEALRALAQGPGANGVRSGAALFDAIVDLRDCVGLAGERLPWDAAEGYSLFFDELITRVEAGKWFEETVPALARLLMRLPSLLEGHYRNADHIFGQRCGIKTGLRVLASQEIGIVVLSQELVGALLACSLFCLFPVANRDALHLPTINFNFLFGSLCRTQWISQEHKILCLKHYFERICLSMPSGYVSFQRKVLPLEHPTASYPDTDFWSNSSVSLCPFEVMHSGLIEDQQRGAIEVDFANKFIGGGALYTGCVQEEIRFVINPELIAAMLFLPAMAYNEAVEIVGVERFSSYGGYASSFQFLGDYQDDRPIDSMGRRKTTIVAIDALHDPRNRQYAAKGLLRELNKAFCGFLHQPIKEVSKKMECQSAAAAADDPGMKNKLSNQMPEEPKCMNTGEIPIENTSNIQLIEVLNRKVDPHIHTDGNVGVATGNWGCGAFGGDVELKSIIQWLAASQAQGQFILYYTFREKALSRLGEVTQWILAHEWSVGDLWNMLLDYSSQRLKGDTYLGFLDWLLPTSTYPQAVIM